MTTFHAPIVRDRIMPMTSTSLSCLFMSVISLYTMRKAPTARLSTNRPTRRGEKLFITLLPQVLNHFRDSNERRGLGIPLLNPDMPINPENGDNQVI
jgi:hypothetical protein